MSDAKAPAALGFRAVRGGAVVVAIAVQDAAPSVVLSTFLATAAEGDRVAFEPYHVAAEMARRQNGSPSRWRGAWPEDVLAGAAAVVAEGRKRQDARALEGVSLILDLVGERGFEPRIAAVLINRAGWLTEELRLPHSLSAPEHPPVIEGLAVRDAIRTALNRHHLQATEMDEKSLPEVASEVLGLSPGTLDGRLKDLGVAAGRPWRKEQKLACLAAWLALAAR